MKHAMLMALALAAVPLVGCDDRGTALGALTSTPDGAAPEDPRVPEVPADAAPDAGAPETGAEPDAEAPSGYEAMCRHYCQTLEQTLLYACLDSDGPDAGCADRFAGTSQQCFELRCVPHRVPPSLCPVQCDALARYYRPACARPDLSGSPLCAVPADERDRLCREGC
jgi:hypothetical protein